MTVGGLSQGLQGAKWTQTHRPFGGGHNSPFGMCIPRFLLASFYQINHSEVQANLFAIDGPRGPSPISSTPLRRHRVVPRGYN